MYKRQVVQWKRKYISWKVSKAKKIYRSYKSFYSEMWESAVKGELTNSQKRLIIDIGKALEQQEEE